MANKRPTLDIGNTTKNSTVKNNLLCDGTINVTDEGASNVTIGDRVENVDSENITLASNITYRTSGKKNEEDAAFHASTSDGRAVFSGPTQIGNRFQNIQTKFLQAENTFIFNNGTHPSTDPIIFQVKVPETSFTGRSTELHRLHQFFSVIVKVIGVVYGMGGVGKTQLVREFIKRNRDLYSNFIWIHSGEVTSIEQSFAVLSKELRLPLKDADGDRLESESVIARVLEKLCKRKTLFVYDNVDKPESTDYLKSILGKALTVDADNLHVLITSQHQEWPLEFERFSLNVWDKTESVEYVSKILDGRGNDTVDDKESLAETLQYFPLALRQATAFINVQRRRSGSKFKISEFIGTFNRKTREMLRDEKFKTQMINIYERTTYTAWRIARNEIKRDEVNGALAMRILNIIAFCGPDRIRREFFYCVANGQIKDKEKVEFEDWKEAVDSAVDLLTTYCMVNRVEEEDSEGSSLYKDIHLSIHQLVQKVTRLLLEESNEVNTSLRDALQLLSNLAATGRYAFGFYNWEHIKSIFNSAFSSSIKEILIKDFSSLPVIIVRDADVFSATEFGDEILVPMTNILGPGNRHVLKIRYYVALSTLNSYPNDDETLVDFFEIFEKQKVHLSEVDSDTLGTQCQILHSYIELGRLEKAVSWLKHNNCFGDIFDDVDSTFEKYKNNCQITLPLYQSILRVQKSLLGEGHYDTISTLHKIVDAQHGQGNSELVFKCVKELFEVKWRCTPNRDKLKILDELLNIAMDKISSIYLAMGYLEYRPSNYYCPLRMYQFVLTQKRNLQGDTDSDIFGTLHSIAWEHHILENYNASARLFESALKIRTGVNNDTWKIMSQVSWTHHHLGNFDAAEEWYQNAVDSNLIGTANEDNEMLRIMLFEVFSQRKNKNYDLALRWYKIILKKLVALLGEAHPRNVQIMYEIASTYIDLEVSDNAFNWYQKAIDIQKKSLRGGHSYPVETIYEIARTHGKFKYNDQALDQYRNAFDKLIEIKTDIIMTYYDIDEEVNFHLKKENYELALGLLEITFERKEDLLGANHFLIREILRFKEHIQNLVAVRHPADALKLFQVELEKQKESLGGSHCDTLKTMRLIAYAHFKLKDYQCALRMFEDLLERHKVVSSESIDNPSVDESFDDSSIDDPNINTVEIQCLIARTHGYLTSNDAGLEMYRNILDKLIEGAESIDKIDWRTIDNEARFFSENESYNLALGLYNIIFEEKKKNLGADHYLTLLTLSKKDSIQILIAERHPADALKLFQVEFDKQKESLGESHCDTLKTMRRVANAHFKLKDYQCALRMFKDLLEKHKVVSSESIGDPSMNESFDDPSIDAAVEIQCLIARTHACLASDNAALEMYRNILDELIERAESIDKIDWRTIENEAESLYEDKSYNLALGLCNIIFQEKKRNLGADHDETLYTSGRIHYIQREAMWNLLRTCSKRQNYNDAIFTYGNELEIASQRLADNTDVWTKFYDEASFQFDVQNYELALRFYELLLEKQMFWFDVDYSFTLKTMHEIARIQAKLKRYDQALNTYQVVLNTRKTSLGDFHPDTLETMSQLAHLHKKLGNHSDAIQLYRQVYVILKYLKGSEHPDAIRAFQLGELEERDVSMDYLPDSLKEEFEFTERHRKLRATK